MATRLDQRMQDLDLVDAGPGLWQLAPGRKVMADNWPAVRVHPDAPAERRGTKVSPRYKDALAEALGRRDWYLWYAEKCLTPVIIVGTGREHIQKQRQVLLEEVRHWFIQETAALLDEDSANTSNPERTLFHPFMVFDAGVGTDRPWLREMLPRLVITTSWSSRNRMHPALFSRAPHVIITNRRVRSETEAMFELNELPAYEGLESIVNEGRPESIGVSVFAATAQGETDDDLEGVL